MRPLGVRARSAQQGARRNDRRGFQIGPRIRVGGSLGALGQKAKIGAGKVLSNKYVGAGLSLIPGVGPGLAAAANVAGNVLDTSDGGINSLGDVGGVALDAAKVYGTGKFLNAAKGGLANLGRGAPSIPGAPPLPGPSMAGSGIVPSVGAAPGLATEAGGGFASRALDAGKGVLSFAEQHPNAASGALQGLGNMVGGGGDRRYQDAQTRRLEQESDESAYDFEQRKRREAELAPIWGNLGTSVGSGYSGIAPNPYLPAGG